MSNIATPNTPAVDGIAHGLAVAIVEAVQAIAAGLTPEAVQEAAEARARAEGHPTPQEAAKSALWACLEALEAVRRQMLPAGEVGETESEGGEA
jgi:hypothetical protein